MVEIGPLDPSRCGRRIEIAIELRALALRQPVILLIGPGVAAPDVVLLQPCDKAAGGLAVAERLRPGLPLLAEQFELERHALA
jgi:hypothetical protein